MKKLEKYIHIDFYGPHNWGKRVLTAIDNAISKNKINVGFPSDENIILYIAIRLNMIYRLTSNTSTLVNEFINAATAQYTNNPDCEYTDNKHGHALRGIDDKIIYSLLLNIDSLFFEIKSCWELVMNFIEKVYSIANIQFSRESIIQTLPNTNQWYKILEKYRNYFIHEAAPYLAIDSSMKPWRIVIIHDHNELLNEENTISFDEINIVTNSFQISMNTLQNRLISLFE